MDELIKQSNYLTQAHYSLTATEKNIVFFTLRELTKMYKGDYSELLTKNWSGCKIKLRKAEIIVKNNHTRFYLLMRDFGAKWFRYQRDGKDYYTSIISGINWSEESEYLTVSISPDAGFILGNLVKGYTKFSGTIAISLKSVWSKRMYEICHQYLDKKKGSGWWIISVEDFRQMFQLENKYPAFRNIRYRVLDVAKKELDNTADVSFSYETTKIGRRLDKIHFTIYKTGKYKEEVKKLSIDDDDRIRLLNKLKTFFTVKESIDYVNKIEPKEIWKILSEMNNNDKIRSKGGWLRSRLDKNI